MKRRFSFLPAAAALVLFASLTVMAVAQPVPELGGITWQKYPAPEGGIIHCIHAQEALVLAGTTEGAYRSDDAGRHWKLTVLNRQRVHCFFRLQDGRLLAGTDRGISASTDDGIRWLQLTEQFECTALYEAEDGTLFAGKSMGNKDTIAIYTSTDGGASWQDRATLHVYMPTRISRIFSHDSALYLVNAPKSYWQGAESANIYVSHDAGVSWRMLFPYWDGRDPLGALFTSSGSLIVGGKWKGVTRSTDLGSSWSIIEAGFEAETQGSVWSLLELDDGSILAGCQESVFRSTDDGMTWTRTSAPQKLVKDLADNGRGIVFAATATGVQISTDGGLSWEERNTGISAGWFGSLSRTAAGGVSMFRYAEEGRSTLYRTAASVGSWDSLFIPNEQFGAFRENDRGDFFTSHSGIWYSTDKGGQWQRAANPSRNWMSVGDWLSYGDSIIIWGGNRSTDNGRTWVGNFPFYSTTRIAAFGDGSLYSFDSQSTPTKLLRSTDTAATWEIVMGKIRSVTRSLSPLDLSEAEDGTLLLGTHDGVYRWRPGDSTFADAGLNRMYCSQVESLPGGAVIVGTDTDGTFLTTDNGSTWTPCSDGLTQLRVWQMMRDGDGHLLVASEAGMFRTRCLFGERSDLTLDAPTQDMPIVAVDSRVIVPLRWISRSAGLQTLGMRVSYAEKELSLRNVTGLLVHTFEIDKASDTETILAIDAEGNDSDTSRIFLPFDVVKKPERDPVICSIALCPVLEHSTPQTISLCDCETVRVLVDGICNPIIRLADRLQLGAYPNPGTDAVHVRYRLPEKQPVQLKVLDNAGREVLQQPVENQTAGFHEFIMNTTAWPAGVYRIVLLAGEAATSTSLSIVR